MQLSVARTLPGAPTLGAVDNKPLKYGSGWEKRAKDFARVHERAHADLAADVTEILEAAGYKGVGRAAVGHWLNGRNPPTLPQFLALCDALGADPGHILFDRPMFPDMVRSADMKRALKAHPELSQNHQALMEKLRSSKARAFAKKRRQLRRVVRLT